MKQRCRESIQKQPGTRKPAAELSPGKKTINIQDNRNGGMAWSHLPKPISGSSAQLAQAKFAEGVAQLQGVEEEELLQGKFAAQLQGPEEEELQG